MSQFLRQILSATVVIAVLSAAPAIAAELRTVESDHYRLHTDVDRDLADSSAHRMDVMWGEYARRLADFPLPAANRKFDVYLFARKADYVRMTGDRFSNTGGLFVPSRKLLAVYLENQGREGLRRTLQHEAFHQFAQVAIGEKLPVWLNEGLAQIFEEGIWTGDRFIIGQMPPARIAILQRDLAAHRLTPFKDFLALSDQQWLSNLRDKPVAVRQYNQAWAMTQFLVYATDADGHALFVDDLIDMLKLVHHGVGGQKAFEMAFSDNYAGFERLFNDWAESIRPTAQASYVEHQAVLADMILQLYGRGEHFDDITAFRHYLIAGEFSLASGDGAAAMAPETFFCDLTGRALGPKQLFLVQQHDTPTPDIICQPNSKLRLRTHFAMDADALSYETTVDSP